MMGKCKFMHDNLTRLESRRATTEAAARAEGENRCMRGIKSRNCPEPVSDGSSTVEKLGHSSGP